MIFVIAQKDILISPPLADIAWNGKIVNVSDQGKHLELTVHIIKDGVNVFLAGVNIYHIAFVSSKVEHHF